VQTEAADLVGSTRAALATARDEQAQALVLSRQERPARGGTGEAVGLVVGLGLDLDLGLGSDEDEGEDEGVLADILGLGKENARQVGHPRNRSQGRGQLRAQPSAHSQPRATTTKPPKAHSRRAPLRAPQAQAQAQARPLSSGVADAAEAERVVLTRLRGRLGQGL